MASSSLPSLNSFPLGAVRKSTKQQLARFMVLKQQAKKIEEGLKPGFKNERDDNATITTEEQQLQVSLQRLLSLDDYGEEDASELQIPNKDT
ncbi:conserved hypothetical protein [Ricinus communis]|uniref:Uncharacterized protein n=1 Tax=Ricinus communis TaxID=3988 RepID=B9SXV2_RICCO|nr:conserved hypothetical protein [Ricinus communis]